MKILITGAWNANADELRKIRALGHETVFQQRENAPLVCPCEEVEGVICNGLFLAHPIEKFVRLKYIQLTSAGFDRVPMEYVRTHGIEIHNARGVYSIPMAEHALAGVLSLYRKMAEFHELQKKAEWEKIRDLEELYGRRVLVLGCGSVGRETARRFTAMGCFVEGIDAAPVKDDAFTHIFPPEKLDARLPAADIVVLTLPLTPETEHLFDAGRLKLMKDDSVLVNIARGGIMDPRALEKELSSGRLRAVLDVFEEEPLPGESPLWQCANVIITPHNSFVGNGAAARLVDVILNHLKKK